jgi:hypothetical protein
MNFVVLSSLGRSSSAWTNVSQVYGETADNKRFDWQHVQSALPDRVIARHRVRPVGRAGAG